MPRPLFLSLLALLVVLGAQVMLSPRAQAGAPAPTIRIEAPAPTMPPIVHRKTAQMRGFSLQMEHRPDTAFDLDAYLKAIDELSADGCTWVNLAIAGRQDDIHAEGIVWDHSLTASDDQILQIMAQAKQHGMGIMMMPMVLLRKFGPTDWRGVIAPPNWDNWFSSYTRFITEMARIAQKGDVDIFVVGSELLSTEEFRDHWISTIKQIKKVYQGKLTYSSNWDHYESVTFWDQLDYVGMNNYYELADKPGVPVEKLNEAWKPIQKNILDFAAKQHKPLMFTEVGWHNLVNTLSQPWNYVATGPIDLKEQERAFQSFVETWQPVSQGQFMGAFIWEWCPLGKVTDHGTYSLQGTPALEVVKKWFAAP